MIKYLNEIKNKVVVIFTAKLPNRYMGKLQDSEGGT